jgi:hypothetical protein
VDVDDVARDAKAKGELVARDPARSTNDQSVMATFCSTRLEVRA